MSVATNPFFSIIVPVYNCENYLEECIKSVINQTYESWELILIDDGSTDSSGEICDEFCRDPRISVIHQENAGAMSSRINGIAIATGKYELGLDADDYLDVNCLEIIKNAIDTSGSDLIFFGYRYTDKQLGEHRCTLTPNRMYSQREILEEVFKTTDCSLSDKAIRMDKVKQADYTGLEKRLSINLDFAQLIPILCNIDNGYAIGNVLYNYRILNESISHTCTVEKIFDVGISTEYVIHKLEKALLFNKDIHQMICLGYLKTIIGRILDLFVNKKITEEDCKNIHNSDIYISSKCAELIKNFELYWFIILKIFRYRQYWILKLIAWKQRNW